MLCGLGLVGLVGIGAGVGIGFAVGVLSSGLLGPSSASCDKRKQHRGRIPERHLRDGQLRGCYGLAVTGKEVLL